MDKPPKNTAHKTPHTPQNTSPISPHNSHHSPTNHTPLTYQTTPGSHLTLQRTPPNTHFSSSNPHHPLTLPPHHTSTSKPRNHRPVIGPFVITRPSFPAYPSPSRLVPSPLTLNPWSNVCESTTEKNQSSLFCSEFFGPGHISGERIFHVVQRCTNPAALRFAAGRDMLQNCVTIADPPFRSFYYKMRNYS